MTVAELERRLVALEQAVHKLQSHPRAVPQQWWKEAFGRFADDPVFDEIVGLGQEYRRARISEN